MAMGLSNIRNALLVGVAAAALSASPALAIPINTAFNFVPTGLLVSDTGDVTTATTITAGSPLVVTAIVTDNTGLVSGQTLSLTTPTPLLLGSTFVKAFTTALGTFTESLTVTSSEAGTHSRGILASGTITETTYTSGPVFDPTPIFYSAAYTQNAGPGTQINGSFNDSTTALPPPIPEPASMALLGAGLLVVSALRRQRKS